jgi:hypothetical protein
VADLNFKPLIVAGGYAGQCDRRDFDKVLVVSVVSEPLSPSQKRPTLQGSLLAEPRGIETARPLLLDGPPPKILAASYHLYILRR